MVGAAELVCAGCGRLVPCLVADGSGLCVGCWQAQRKGPRRRRLMPRGR